MIVAKATAATIAADRNIPFKRAHRNNNAAVTMPNEAAKESDEMVLM